MTDNDGAHNYVYDQLYRLIDATHPQPENPAENFNYDQVGNRTDSHLSTIYTVDNMNRLVEDDTFTYTYDDSGNTAQKVTKATGEVDVYAYDSEDRLSNYEKYPSLIAAIPTTQATYNYDGMGRRIAKTVDGLLTKFIYDEKDILLDLSADDIPVARYTRTMEIDDLISANRDTTADGSFDAAYYYHKDGLGSVAVITDSSGIVAEKYIYDSFGNIINTTSGAENSYTYTARELDQESDLYYYRARYYDPFSGLFLTQDPSHFPQKPGTDIRYFLPNLLKDPSELNLYKYVAGNPLNFTDPLGLGWFGTNWCGPGGGGGSVNCYDIACKSHDKCYEKCGLNASTRWTRKNILKRCPFDCDKKLLKDWKNCTSC